MSGNVREKPNGQAPVPATCSPLVWLGSVWFLGASALWMQGENPEFRAKAAVALICVSPHFCLPLSGSFCLLFLYPSLSPCLLSQDLLLQLCSDSCRADRAGFCAHQCHL
jgi:hypothetical protein